MSSKTSDEDPMDWTVSGHTSWENECPVEAGQECLIQYAQSPAAEYPDWTTYCYECRIHFADPFDLFTHQTSHHPQCVYCNARFRTCEQLSAHQRVDHPDEMAAVDQILPIGDDNWNTYDIDQGFQHMGHSPAEMNNLQAKEQSAAVSSMEAGQSPRLFAQHELPIQDHIPETLASNEENTDMRCDACGLQFPNAVAWTDHNTEHHLLSGTGSHEDLDAISRTISQDSSIADAIQAGQNQTSQQRLTPVRVPAQPVMENSQVTHVKQAERRRYHATPSSEYLKAKRDTEPMRRKIEEMRRQRLQDQEDATSNEDIHVDRRVEGLAGKNLRSPLLKASSSRTTTQAERFAAYLNQGDEQNRSKWKSRKRWRNPSLLRKETKEASLSAVQNDDAPQEHQLRKGNNVPPHEKKYNRLKGTVPKITALGHGFNVTAVELITYLPRLLQTFEPAKRLVEGGGFTKQVICKIIDHSRGYEGADGMLQNTLMTQVERGMRDRDKAATHNMAWTFGNSQPDSTWINSLSVDDLTNSRTAWYEQNRKPVPKQTQCRMIDLAKGVQNHPEGADALDLTRVMKHVHETNNTEAVFPDDVVMIRDEILGGPSPVTLEHMDAASLRRWLARVDVRGR